MLMRFGGNIAHVKRRVGNMTHVMEKLGEQHTS